MIKRQPLVTESVVGLVLINVDIQPEYEKSFSFKKEKWAEFLNQNYEVAARMVFLYNGHETLGFVTEREYKYWLYDVGVSGEVVGGSLFYDKGYAFFQYCMDNYLDDDVVANFVRFMYDNNVVDSRDMTRERWAQYLRQYRRTDRKEVYELLKHANDCIHIPNLMDFLKRFNNPVLTGGHIEACLKEVEIALKALRKNYSVLREFTY
jgi:hypothetical protein